MTPPKKETIPPAGGWSEHTLYLVEVSYRPCNPVHQSYLRVGFLDDETGQPGAYTQLWNGAYEEPQAFNTTYYLRVIQVLHKEET